MENIVELRGDLPGPTSFILVGVHGNEVCGLKAFEELLPNLKIERGKVFFGYGNPRAIAEGKRFVETNLNRMFKKDFDLSAEDKASYEYKRAQFLKKYLDQSDVLLDIHASTTKDSRCFVIAENNARSLLKFLPVGLSVSGFDEIEPGGTDYYMNRIGKVGICVECGYLADYQSVTVAKESIFNFLGARGHILFKPPVFSQQEARLTSLYLTKTSNFQFVKKFSDFEDLRAGKLIAFDGGLEIRADEDCQILFPCQVKRVGEEAFLLIKKKS